jgi:hypothetical protein
MDVMDLSKMVGRQLPFFSVLIPFWVVAAYGGWRAVRGVWPVALAAGLGFAVPQFLVSNFHGPWLVDNVSGLCSIAAILGVLRVWQPRPEPGTPWAGDAGAGAGAGAVGAPGVVGAGERLDRRQVWRAWMPWAILSVVIFAWGLPPTKAFLEGRPQSAAAVRAWTQPTRGAGWREGRAQWTLPVAGLDGRVQSGSAPVAPLDAMPNRRRRSTPSIALSATGTGILLAGFIAGLVPWGLVCVKDGAGGSTDEPW